MSTIERALEAYEKHKVTVEEYQARITAEYNAGHTAKVSQAMRDALGAEPDRVEGKECWIGEYLFDWEYEGDYLIVLHKCPECGEMIYGTYVRSLADFGRCIAQAPTHLCYHCHAKKHPSAPSLEEQFVSYIRDIVHSELGRCLKEDE